MAKYDFNFKMKVVKSYLDGEGGLAFLKKLRASVMNVPEILKINAKQK